MTEWEEMVLAMKKRGKEDGLAAASWYWDDVNVEFADFMQVLKGIRDVDPRIMDTLPTPQLSGEWAGDMSPSELLFDTLGFVPDAEDDQVLLNEYESQFNYWSQQRIWCDCLKNIIEHIDAEYLDEIEEVSERIRSIMEEAEVLHASEQQLRLLMFKEKVQGLRVHLDSVLESALRDVGNKNAFV